MSSDEQKQDNGNKEQEEQGKTDKSQHASKKESKQDKKLQKQVDQLQQQMEELTQELKRERADFANYQRRTEEEKGQILSQAKSEVITQLLPLMDDLERALLHIPQELQDNPWAQGVGKVYEQSQEKLKGLGVKKIEALNQPFDPQIHEAVEFEDGNGSNETVIEELRKGYMLEGKVLRPAMVKVGKTADQPQDYDNGEDNEQDNDKEEQ